VDLDGVAVQQNLPGVGLVQPVQDFHQGAFAGSILAQQGVNLAGFHLKIDVIVGQHAGETLDDAAHFQGLDARPGVGLKIE
jgi:hypothetical protein